MEQLNISMGIFIGSILLKNRRQEIFNKLINSINTIIRCGIWQTVKFQFVSSF